MATTRVYILARELGVKSSAIVKKCQDEGLDVRNHMATISAGLAATIREWFSEGENVTTVETAERVDLEEVRVKKPRQRESTQVAPELELQEADVSVAEAEEGVDEPAMGEEQEEQAVVMEQAAPTVEIQDEPAAPLTMMQVEPPPLWKWRLLRLRNRQSRRSQRSS